MSNMTHKPFREALLAAASAKSAETAKAVAKVAAAARK